MVATSPLRRIVTLSTLAIGAIGAMALTGFWHPNAPAEAMRMYLPKITLPTVVIAAAVDGTLCDYNGETTPLHNLECKAEENMVCLRIQKEL